MPNAESSRPVRRRGRGRRPALLLLKHLGLLGFLGGLAALAAMSWLTTTPESIDGWMVLRSAMRSVFFPCVFVGLIITVLAGLALFLQHPGTFARQRWLRTKVVYLALTLPVLHFWARGRVLHLDDVLASRDLDAIADAWHQCAVAFIVGLVVMLPAAALSRIKPRLGQPIGARRPESDA